VSPLGPGEIRARRRPWLILCLAGSRFLLAVCLAWPLSSLVASTGIGLRAEGDRALFEGGGYFLLEVLRLRGAELEATLHGLLPVLALGLLLTAAGNSALLVALNVRERLTPRELLARAGDRLPGLVVLGLGTALAQGLLVLVGALAVSAVPASLANSVSTTAEQGALLLVFALAVGAVGGFSDVAKASLVRHESPLRQALPRALECLRHLPIRATFGWVPWAFAFGAAALFGAKLCEACDVSRPGAWRVVAVFVTHQLVIVVAVAARAGWFARALRLIATDVASHARSY
jgi:hypothetical protein